MTIKRIIVASSDKAYGEHRELSYREDFSLRGLHPYDASKSCADILTQTYFHTYKLPVGITRYSNVYGGGDLNFDRIIPDTIRSLIYDKNPVVRSDGTYVRDYLFIQDAIRGVFTFSRTIG